MSHFDEIHFVQARYRRWLARTWPVRSCARVLEIGCGQGDMTCVLAEMVGDQGQVVAIDEAGRDYGAPMTLGEATDKIKQSMIGHRIDFLFETNLHKQGFPEDSFDIAVLAHSSWYFSSRNELHDTLSTLRQVARILCFAEWALALRSFEQIPHFLAVLLQAQVDVYRKEATSNVRTPLTPGQLRSLLEETGWQIKLETQVQTTGLQDADWEVDMALREPIDQPSLPPRLRDLIAGQREILADLAGSIDFEPLDAYSVVAERLD